MGQLTTKNVMTMKKNYIIAFASLALALIGCSKKEVVETPEGNTTVIEVACPDTKAVLAEDGLTVNWQVGDKIKVNDKNSVGLTAADITSPTSARFTFNDVLAAPYYAMFNATNGYQFKTGEEEEGGPHCRVNLDSPQTYAENSFDSHVATYWGVSDTPAISFNHAMAYIKVTPTTGSAPDAKISYIMLSSLSGNETLAGRFHLYFNDGHLSPVEGHDNNRNYVVMNAASEEGVELGKPFIIAIPVQEYSAGISVRIASVDGKYMDRNIKSFTAVAGKLYHLETTFDPKGEVLPVAQACEVSSSTVNFTWSYGEDAAAAIAKAWTVELYKDAALSDKVAGYDIPESSAIWKSVQPKFCFGGLAQNTEYYFRVSVKDENKWSEVVSAKTTVYDLSVVTSNLKAGDMIAATDFHELMEGGETPTLAAAFGKNQNDFKDCNADGSYIFSTANMAEGGLWASSSFKDWGYARTGGSANAYPHQGHIKLGTSGASAYLASPALSAIEGSAEVEVEFTAASYNNNTEYGKIKECFVATDRGTFNGEHLLAIGSIDFVNKAVVTMTDNKNWVTYKATLTGVTAEDHIIIGPNYNGANTRFCISDVKIIYKGSSTPAPDFYAAAAETSSSTLCFVFGKDGSASSDIKLDYDIYLYSDAACQNEVQHYATPAAGNKWSNKQPKFVFGGLNPNTTYYFKAKTGDTWSEVIESKTDDFTIVRMSDTPAAEGDVILAEDFRDCRDGGEGVAGAAAFGVVQNAFKASTDTYTAGWTNYTDASFYDWGFMRENTGVTGGNFYVAQGHTKLGVGGNGTWLVSPELKAIPEGKKATLEVEVTMAAYAASSDWTNVKEGVVGLTQGAFDSNHMIPAKFMVDGDTSDKAVFTMTTNNKWVTYKVTVQNATSAHRLFIGVNATGSNKRANINDVKVKIIAIN